MSRVAKWIVGGYPAAWRERYGEEITTLIEDSGGGWLAALDVLGGGVKMHFRGRNFPAIAAVMGLVGAVAGLGASYLVAPEYRSVARVEVKGKRPAGREQLRDMASDIVMMVRSRSELSSVIQSPRLNLYDKERAKDPLELVIRQMNEALVLDVDGFQADSIFLKVEFRYRDRYKAQTAVWDLTGHILHQLRQHKASLASIGVMKWPNLPLVAEGPDRRLFVLCGFVTGIVMALALTLWFRRPGSATPVVTG